MYWVKEEGSGVWSCIIKYRFPGELLRIALLPSSANWQPPPPGDIGNPDDDGLSAGKPWFRVGSGKSLTLTFPDVLGMFSVSVKMRRRLCFPPSKLLTVFTSLKKLHKTPSASSAEAQKRRHNNVTANKKEAKRVCFLSPVAPGEFGSKVSLVSTSKQVEVWQVLPKPGDSGGSASFVLHSAEQQSDKLVKPESSVYTGSRFFFCLVFIVCDGQGFAKSRLPLGWKTVTFLLGFRPEFDGTDERGLTSPAHQIRTSVCRLAGQGLFPTCHFISLASTFN